MNTFVYPGVRLLKLMLDFMHFECIESKKWDSVEYLNNE